MTSEALTAEWTETNEQIFRKWVRSLFNQDSIVENYLADVAAYGAELALFSVRYNKNFSDTLFEHGVDGWQEEVAEEEWNAACQRFGIVIDEHDTTSIQPGSEFERAVSGAA